MQRHFSRFYKKTLLTLLTFAVSPLVFAEKMDLDTHTAVIERLATIVKNLDDSDVSKVPSVLRLADLLSERSRLKAMKEVEKDCTNCLKSVEDRRQALGYYSYAVPRLSGENYSQALLQKGYLHYSLGETAQTEQIYKDIIAKGRKIHTPSILGQAYASLGDLYFQKADFKKAKAHYEAALKINETPQKGLVHYRIAWCNFNLDNVPKAISLLEMVLQTPRLTETVSATGPVQDESFKLEVSKDLASFYARAPITRTTINRLIKLSPAGQKQQNLFYLGTEADRLGKKRESALVWMIYLEGNTQDKEALEAQIRLMKLKRDMGDRKGALATFSHVADSWKTHSGCGDKAKCEQLQGQIRKWIVDWNREEKKNQTVELTQAFIMYTTMFPTDEEMLIWGATVAQQRHQYRSAFELYRKAADVAYEKKSAKTLEGALISEIDMSETLKNYELRLLAYNHYLQLNRRGPKEFEVRYQISQTEFEKKNYEKSANLFRSLALENSDKKNASLQKTAADMSIESLIKLKREDTIEGWSADYIKQFPKHKNTFIAIHRKALLNNTAARINQNKANEQDLAKLNAVSIVGSTPQDRISLYKSRYLLAIRLEKFADAKKANMDLLSIKNLSANDHNQAWQNRIWLAELELDFSTAYSLAKSQPGKMTADRALRLIWLAQMAHVNPAAHENDFLRLSGHRSLRAGVIAGRIQRSNNPEKEIKPYLKELSKSPETLARLALEIYANTKKMSIIKTANDFRSVRKSSTGGIITRLLQYPDLKKQIAEITFSRLDSRSDKALKKSLENRIALLRNLEKTGQRAISSGDLVLQAIVIDTLRIENGRLHDDIIKLPMPRGLKRAQQIQYQDLVAEQAKPYQIKASQFENKERQLWSKSQWSERLAENYVQARPEYKPALHQDLDMLAKHAPVETRAALVLAMSESPKTPSDKAINQARNQVKKNPFEAGYVTALKDLELLRGNDVLVAHLDARLHQMKGITK
jgi:hypothetical protein